MTKTATITVTREVEITLPDANGMQESIDGLSTRWTATKEMLDKIDHSDIDDVNQAIEDLQSVIDHIQVLEESASSVQHSLSRIQHKLES